MRAIFKIDIRGNYMIRPRRDSLHAPRLQVQTEAVRMNAHDPAFRFCPACGAALESRQLKAGEPLRPVCPQCGYVHYLDPKVAVGTVIVTAEQKIVLVRRAIEPGYGLWVFPGGYVDRGEEITVAAIREAREEAGLDVRLDGLINIYSYPGRPIVVVVYKASVISGELRIDEESLEAGLFSRSEIPWDRLAFRSTHEALDDFYTGILHPVRQYE
jgi:8-oxo-dGTP diphosphatase